MRQMSNHTSFILPLEERPNFEEPGVWEKNPSTKLSAVVVISGYHLAKSGRQPMRNEGGKLHDGPPELMDDYEEGQIDRIIIYSYFNANTISIRQVRI